MCRLSIFVAAIGLGFPSGLLQAAELNLTSPLDYEVIQRDHADQRAIAIAGEMKDSSVPFNAVEARLTTEEEAGDWELLRGRVEGFQFSAHFDVPVGGWYRLEVRVLSDRKPLAESAVDHIGVGEIFVVAGQSNSANHGEERQITKTGMVTNFDGARWQLANDPQPGASGGGGSFVAPLGDALSERFKVPVGFITCGIGATSVREWLPESETFPNPPTIEGNVRKRADGLWESNGQAFKRFTGRMKPPGPKGFRAVLWHQGESDANQRDPTRTLEGKLYREYLGRIITESNREIGWEVPWFVAQVSYHVPGDEASPDIRAAQASLWKDGIALEGPDSDALKGELRERGGKGVHFSGPGLREHAARWAEKVGPWLERQRGKSP